MLSLLKSLLKRRRSVSLAGNGGLRLLNLGCGTMRDSAWENYDFAPVDSGVKPIDLGRPLPFPEASYEVCYMSHVLEHLPRQRVPQLLSEMFVTLKPGGVIRLVVPDLEIIARVYLAELESAVTGDPAAVRRHEWMTLELIDQITRSFSGGFMLRTMWSRPLPHRAFIEKRVGLDGRKWIDLADADGGSLERRIQPSEIYTLQEPADKEARRFRQTGENHRWMYDRVSLGRLLQESGFQDVRVCGAKESSIASFSDYNLDTDECGFVRKPDSLFMEALKPSL